MSKKNITALILCAMLLASCSNSSNQDFSTATTTFSLTPTITSTKSPVPTKIPASTITPIPKVTIESYSNHFPVNSILEPLSVKQQNEVIACDIQKLASERYPENILRDDFTNTADEDLSSIKGHGAVLTKVTIDELIQLFDPETSCDWASLAYAYTVRLKDDEKLPDIAKNAFGKAIEKNSGFALATPLFYRYYYDNFMIVESPDIFEQKITIVQIEYNWGGMGDQVEYTVEIKQADTNPIVTLRNLTPATLGEQAKTKVNTETIQTLGKSLNNLVPISSQFSLTTCYDNYPDWTATLTLKDGSAVELKTNKSNMIYIGGPWQVNIDGQNYIQFSIEFIKAIDTLIQEIGLPYGQPMAMTCGTRDVFEQAYP